MSLITQFGFTWGPCEVIRACHVEGRGYSIIVKTTEHREVEIYVSEKGHSLKVFERSDARRVGRDWSCVGCGATAGRYDGGDACTACVTESFAEGG